MAVFEWGIRFNNDVAGVSIKSNKVDAQRFGEFCESLEESEGGITPTFLVEKSKPRRSAGHGLFEWDDTKAAEDFRIEQAKLALRSIRIVVDQGKDKPPKSIRGWHSVKIMSEPRKSHYRGFENVMKEPLTRDEVLQNCLRELIHWRTKWADLNEAADSFAAVDGTIRILQQAVAAS